ncbi:hypothetical protein [Alteromonas confluentis]|uniref:Uncharacterized protein n=1 Tax=Alteromonas confluentis TaxID=1656094 RepID=A0A1E7ZAJ1_9ALTE|nr:hypothetical protein [Alteromonas confluentis]OFC70548.1 hypothetical protein BFC18_12370 [Alteromonas confluentis]
MKVLWITLIVIAAVGGFLIGRSTAPTPTSAANEASPGSVSPTPASESSYQQSVMPAPLANSPDNASSTQSVPAQSVADSLADVAPDNGGDSYSNEQTAEQRSYQDLRRVAENNYPAAQQELEEWTELHKADLKSRMETALGENAGFMFDEVMKNNTMLNEPLAQQSMEEDLAWREQTQINLHDYIMMNTTDPTVNILNISCMQRKCEVTMTGKDDRAAILLYMQLMRSGLFGITGGPGPTTMMNDDGTYWMFMLFTF